MLPILPALQQIIDASPCGEMTYLVNDLGRPFTDAGFGNWFRDRCVEACVPGRAHGLRKAGATIAANNGATAHQLMAMFGWRTLKMAEQYTRAADQQRLAEAAMHMLDTREQTRTESCPTEASGGTISKKTEAKSKVNFRGGQERRRIDRLTYCFHEVFFYIITHHTNNDTNKVSLYRCEEMERQDAA